MPEKRRRSTHGSRANDNRRPARQAQRRPPSDLVRRTAYDVLRAVDSRDAYANLLLPKMLRERELGGRDAALATELTYGTLRGQGTYDAILNVCSDRPVDKIDPPLRDLLRLGVHQLLRTRIPSHAAVSTTVDLVRSVAGPGQAKFANAVLRKVTTRDLPAWLVIVAPEDELGRLSITHSHPEWIVSALRDAVGPDEIEDLLAADNERPGVTLVARPGRTSVDALLELGAGPAAYSPYAAYLPEGDPGDLALVRQGHAGVQDEGSQLVALALAEAPLEGRDEFWLDMCAGPGGKAGLLGALADERGPRLLACDIQPHRAALITRVVSAHAGIAVVDATRPAWKPGSFDRVMVDAPCTGLGALRRRPESRWRRTPQNVAELGPLQRKLLEVALDSVRPGGVVAYVTCSPHVAETRLVVDDVLSERDDFQRLDAVDVLTGIAPTLSGLGAGPYAQFWPHRHGTDAMFIALLRRLS